MKRIDYDTATEAQIRKVYQKIGNPRIADGVISRRRAYALKRRDRELSKFQAMQECPKCEAWDFHRMKTKIHRRKYIVRQCNACQHEWEQS